MTLPQPHDVRVERARDLLAAIAQIMTVTGACWRGSGKGEGGLKGRSFYFQGRNEMTKINMSRRSLLQLTAGGIAAVGASKLASPAIAQESKVSWRIQSLWDGGTTPQQYEEMFVQKVAEKTGAPLSSSSFLPDRLCRPPNPSMRSAAARSR